MVYSFSRSNALYRSHAPRGSGYFSADTYHCQYYYAFPRRAWERGSIRYVDDFILINQSKQQLQSWQTQITEFLAQKLKIKIKPAQVKSITNGADFLGYIIRPNYKLVRKRVIGNLYEKLTQLESKIFFNIPNQDRDFRRLALRHETQHYHLHITHLQLSQLQAVLASYWGHFNFVLANNDKLVPLWQATDAYSYITQVQYFRNQYPNAILKIQKGNYFEFYSPNNKNSRSHALRGSGYSSTINNNTLHSHAKHGNEAEDTTTVQSFVKALTVIQHGYLKSGLRHRIINQMTIQL